MTDEILQLESVAKSLEPDADQRRELDQAILSHANNFLNSIDTGKGYEIEDTSHLLSTIQLKENGHEIGELLNLLKEAVDTPGINPASGGHLGYIPGGGIYPSALADYLADVTNRYAGVYFANPGAVRMENQMVRWMSDLVGYPETALGTLTSGGSIANLVAITTARDTLGINPDSIRHSVIYLTEQTHHCIDKAIRIAGLAECVLRRIELDDRFRMDTSKLESQIRHDYDLGLKPAIVVASLGSTDTGAVDPIAIIADIAAKWNIWLHIDAAYGGFFQLVPEMEEHFVGVERSDSYILDPHKGLFLPYGTGAVLIREGVRLHQSQHYVANYMQDAVSLDEYSPAELSPELTRHFRGLRMWLPLHLLGLAPFRAGLKEKWMLARYFHQRIFEEGFEVGPVPELSVVIYRYTRGVQDPNAFNRGLIKLLHRDGRIFVSSTLIRGQVWLRFAALCFRTHLKHVELLLDMLCTARDTLRVQSG